MTDYLAFRRKEEGDVEQHGIKGMRWGIVRDTAAKARDHLSRKSKGEEVTKTKKAAAVEKKTEPDKTEAPSVFGAASGETSPQRYARLSGEAKGGGAGNWTEQDLKFFNARTDAITKVNKMYEQKPSWLQEAAKQTLRTVAQQQMQNIASGVGNKYISGPVIESMKNAKTVAETPQVQKTVGNTAKAVKSSVSTSAKSTPAIRAPGMTPEQTLQYFRDRPRAKPKPANYSPSGNFDLFKELRKEGLID